MDFGKRAVRQARKHGGKIEISSKVELRNRVDLSTVYTPGVAEVSRQIAADKDKVWQLTVKKNTVAVVSDGSAVLGLGDIGPEAALPVMEGKALLFKKFAGIDAWPIVLATQDTRQIIETVERIAPGFGGVNLEDISAPRCFEIERELIKRLDIPVFHDDQHGAAIVVVAGLMNALKVVKKSLGKVRIVVNGVGAAGGATVRLLEFMGVEDILALDSQGILYEGRGEMDWSKRELAELTNKKRLEGGLKEAVKGADVFVGLSAPGVLKLEMVRSMARGAIVFAMANPVPEIMPQEAKKAGAAVVATGRSDYPNQLNNALVFPGLFRGLLDKKIRRVTMEMKVRLAKALAGLVKQPTREKIVPTIFDKLVVAIMAEAVGS